MPNIEQFDVGLYDVLQGRHGPRLRCSSYLAACAKLRPRL